MSTPPKTVRIADTVCAPLHARVSFPDEDVPADRTWRRTSTGTSRRLHLLVIDASQDDAFLIVRELSRAGYAVCPERVDTREALAAALLRQRWDLAIADYTMPAFSGTGALTLVREHDADVPFIFVSGTMGEDAAVGAMKTGAQDCIMKGNLTRLVPAVERELREAAGRLLRRKAEARLAHLAYHDALTDLPNRVLFHDRLRQALLGSQRTREPMTLMMLDLDGFKAVNDTLGHQAGDRVLQQLASRLRALLRETDTVARLGGDEFALLLPRSDGEGATLTARKVLQELARPLVLDGQSLAVGGSLGIAWCPEHGSTADALLQKADLAMYVAKSGGLGYAVYTADSDRRAHQRLTLVSELQRGIERNQFVCDYQPIVHLGTGQVLGVEALARWRHPRRGRLLPRDFIELAEHTGLINPLTMLLMDKALAEWAGPVQWPMRVAVNLSPRNLRDLELPDRIADLLRLHRTVPSALVVEITENLIMSDPSRATSCLSRLHEMGIAISIDDFGSGYSSLAYLRRFPIDQLKVDQSFGARPLPGDEAIARSTIDLAHDLGMTVVATGVDSSAARDRLHALACDAIQGHVIAEPRPPMAVRRWLARRRATSGPGR